MVEGHDAPGGHLDPFAGQKLQRARHELLVNDPLLLGPHGSLNPHKMLARLKRQQPDKAGSLRFLFGGFNG